MDENTISAKKIRVKPIKLTTALLQKLCNIIDEQFNEVKKKENEEIKKEQEDKTYYRKFIYNQKQFSYSLSDGNNKTTHDFEQFLKSFNIKKFKEINLHFNTDNRKIWIWFEKEYGFRDVTVEGDEMWVSGISEHIKNIFEEYETINKFFYTKSAWCLYLGIPILIIMGIIFAINPLTELSEDNERTFLDMIIDKLVFFIIFVLTIPASFSMEGLFHRLYPEIELEHSSQAKIRKFIVTAIAAIVFSVIAGGIIIFFQSLTN